MAALWLALFVATATVFIIWQCRSAKNNEVLGRIQPRLHARMEHRRLVHPVRQPRDPGADLPRPLAGIRPRDARTTATGAACAARPHRLVVGLLPAGQLRAAQPSGDTTLDEIRTPTRSDAVGASFTAVAAVLAIVVVRTDHRAVRRRRVPSVRRAPRPYPVGTPTRRRASTTATGTARRGPTTCRQAGQMLSDPGDGDRRARANARGSRRSSPSRRGSRRGCG